MHVDVGGSQELGGFDEKTRLFESKTLICLLDQVPLHRWPVYVGHVPLHLYGFR